MEYLVGKDYKELCDNCKEAVDSMVEAVLARAAFGEDDDEYASDPEGPLNLACDRRKMCGGSYCLVAEPMEADDLDEQRRFALCIVTVEPTKAGGLLVVAVKEIFAARPSEVQFVGGIYEQKAAERGFTHCHQDRGAYGGCTFTDDKGDDLFICELESVEGSVRYLYNWKLMDIRWEATE